MKKEPIVIYFWCELSLSKVSHTEVQRVFCAEKNDSKMSPNSPNVVLRDINHIELLRQVRGVFLKDYEHQEISLRNKDWKSLPVVIHPIQKGETFESRFPKSVKVPLQPMEWLITICFFSNREGEN